MVPIATVLLGLPVVLSPSWTLSLSSQKRRARTPALVTVWASPRQARRRCPQCSPALQVEGR